MLGDRLQVTVLGARPRAFTVEGAVPRGALLITPHTALAFKAAEVSAETPYRVSYEDIELPLPDRADRREILAIHAEGVPLADDVNLDEMADLTGGWTGADLALVCKKAAILALEDARRCRVGPASEGFYVTGNHLREAHKQVTGMVQLRRCSE